MINFDDATPAAPTGSGNVLWQTDGNGNLSAYVTTAPVIEGTPVDLAGQVAAITATTLLSTTVTGLYRIIWCAKVITPASVSSVLGGAAGFQIKYTDADDSIVVTTTADPLPTGVASLNTDQAQIHGVVIVNALTSTNIQYIFGYTSVGTAMAYALHIRIERVQ